MTTRGDDLTLDEVQAEADGWRVWRTVDCMREPRTLAADTGQELLDLLSDHVAKGSAPAPGPGIVL